MDIIDASTNQQLQSVQYSLTDKHNLRPTCQKDNDELMLQLEDNDGTPSWETNFYCYSVVPLDELLLVAYPQKHSVYDVLICLGLLTEKVTKNDELLKNHPAMKVDKPNKSANFVAGTYVHTCIIKSITSSSLSAQGSTQLQYCMPNKTVESQTWQTIIYIVLL